MILNRVGVNSLRHPVVLQKPAVRNNKTEIVLIISKPKKEKKNVIGCRDGNNIVESNGPVVFELFENYRSTNNSLFTQRIISYVTVKRKQSFIIIFDRIKHQFHILFI